MPYGYQPQDHSTRRFSWESQTSSLLNANGTRQVAGGFPGYDEQAWHYEEVPPHSESSAPESPTRNEWIRVDPSLTAPEQWPRPLATSQLAQHFHTSGEYTEIPSHDFEEDVQSRLPYEDWSDEPEPPRILQVMNGVDEEQLDTGFRASQTPHRLPPLPYEAQDHSTHDPFGSAYFGEDPTGPTRDLSNATGSTIPRSTFNDFDGVHLDSEARDGDFSGHMAADVFQDDTTNEPMPLNRQPYVPYQDNDEWEDVPPPPPQEGMVFYPVPVPAALKMPQRLSRMPAAASQDQVHINGQRDSALRKSYQSGKIRESYEAMIENDAASISSKQLNAGPLKKLPPQLRAALFFDHKPVEHTMEIKNDSAMATLDHFLDQSAIAPIAYGPGSGTPGVNVSRADTNTAGRLSIDHSEHGVDNNWLPPILASQWHTGEVGTGHKTRSRSRLSALSGSSGVGNKDDKEASISLADAIDTELSRRGSSHLALSASRPGTPANDLGVAEQLLGEVDHVDANKITGDAVANWEALEDQSNEAPTTLLAELQLRKQRLKERNKTAATAFPNGMHSTLLELDAVEQIQKKQRKTGRTTLAWEDPNSTANGQINEDEEDDDDRPLGLLYPQNKGLLGGNQNDGDQPTGLIQKLAQEANETLGQRRNRLLGLQAAKSMPKPAVDEPYSDPEHAGETLAQRTRRLRARKALDDAIEVDAGGNKIAGDSNDFTSDIMNRFGGLDNSSREKQVEQKHKDHSDAEETLGQRRRRLQNEAAQSNTKLGTPRAYETARSSLHSSVPLENRPVAASVPQALQLLEGRQTDEPELRMAQGRSSPGPLVSLDPPRDPFVEGQPSKKNSRFESLNDGHGGNTTAAAVNENQATPSTTGRQVSLGWNWGTAHVVAGAPWQHRQQLSDQGAVSESMTESQRRNIDLWRQSVVQ